jgi:hypothetical protein
MLVLPLHPNFQEHRRWLWSKNAMARRSLRFVAFCTVMLGAACATVRPIGPLQAPAPPQKSIAKPVDAGAKNSIGNYVMLVDSEPSGGIVVVNGVPQGRTPQRVALPGTAHGFFRDEVSLKVRFVAVDSDHTSQTVEELLTPLDKIPASIHFTLGGTTRVAR